MLIISCQPRETEGSRSFPTYVHTPGSPVVMNALCIPKVFSVSSQMFRVAGLMFFLFVSVTAVGWQAQKQALSLCAGNFEVA